MSKKTNTHRLTNKNGLGLLVNPLGATIIALYVPTKNGKKVNVVLGMEAKQYQMSNYINNCVYLGCIVGRYAGRISKGEFEIDGVTYPIQHEDGVHLHGGKEGFDKKIWKIDNMTTSKIVMSYESADLEEGYPGKLKVTATYELTENDEVKMLFEANTDKPTHINLTNHSYFNLDGGGSILDHTLQVNSSQVLEVDQQLIPTGKFIDVQETKYDFTKKKIIRDNQFSGLDDAFVLDSANEKVVYSSIKSGIQMIVETNQPGVVIYTPPNLDHLQFLDGSAYGDYPAICFETQKFPDTPHNAHFPSTLLRPNQTYLNQTTLKFSNI